MMAGSGTGDDASEVATETKRVADTETVAEYVGGVKEQPDRPARRLPTSKVSRGEREQMVKEARSIKFPVTVRGYERAAVDRYVQQIKRLIDELEISSYSEAAVRHALAEVSEETREI